MYDTDFWERVKIRQICNFFLAGCEDFREDSGTPKEQQLKHSKAFTKGLRLFRDRVISLDWNTISKDENQRNIKTEELYVEVMDALGELNQLSFRMGFIAGFKIKHEMSEMTEEKEEQTEKKQA